MVAELKHGILLLRHLGSDVSDFTATMLEMFLQLGIGQKCVEAVSTVALLPVAIAWYVCESTEILDPGVVVVLAGLNQEQVDVLLADQLGLAHDVDRALLMLTIDALGPNPDGRDAGGLLAGERAISR